MGDEVSGTSIAISGTTSIDLPTTQAYALVALAVDGDGNFYINAYDSDFTSTVQKWDGSTWTKFRNLPANSSFVRGMSVRHSDGLLAISHSNAIYTTDSTSATGTWTEVSDSTTDPVYFEIVNSLTFDNTGGLVVFGVGRRGDSIERRAKRFNLDDDTSADSQTIPGALVTPTFESAGLNDLHATAQDQRNLTIRQGDAAWTTGRPGIRGNRTQGQASIRLVDKPHTEIQARPRIAPSTLHHPDGGDGVDIRSAGIRGHRQ